MRLRENLALIGKVVLVELSILMLIGVVFYFQFSSAKEEFVNKTRAIAETIGEQASTYFSEIGRKPASDEFYLFLDERLGREKLFNTFEIAPKFFSVVFKEDFDNGSVGGYFRDDDFYPEEGYSVKKNRGIISVTVPFVTRQQSEPFGIVKIDSDNMTILKKVFADNFLLYAAMLVVFNNQAYILYLFTRKKKEEVLVDKGYLKEHSIGALKIMHKILGDIIDDHPADDEKTVGDDTEAEVNKENSGNKKKANESNSAMNVISISKLMTKKEK